MKRQEIYATIKMLAKSQGFYGRILEAIDNMDEFEAYDFWYELEKQGFKDAVDMVLFFEC